MKGYNIECPKCNIIKALQLNKAKKYDGREVTFTCDNCGHKILHKISLKSSVTESGTLVMDYKKHANKIGKLTLIKSELNNGESFILKAGEQNIGRASKTVYNSIPIHTKDTSLSRDHCIINGIFIKDRNTMLYTIKDSKSKNGIMINGEIVFDFDELYLDHNDHIKLGKTVLRFEYI